jgi:hypothetical protein
MPSITMAVDGTCQSGCAAGSYLVPQNLSCDVCSNKYPNCQNCDETACSYCQNSYFLKPDLTCSQSCDDGYYTKVSSRICEECTNIYPNCA